MRLIKRYYLCLLFMLHGVYAIGQQCLYNLNSQAYYSGDSLCNGKYTTVGSNGYKIVTTYKDGKRIKESTYREDSKLYSEIEYDNFEINGIARYYYDNGQLQEEKYFNEGMLDSAKEWYDNGNPQNVVILKDGHISSVKRWYDNGNKKFTGSYVVSSGETNTASEYSSQKAVGLYQYGGDPGVPNGHIKFWYRNGIQSQDITYDIGKIQNVNLYQDRKGHTLSMGTLKNGNGILVRYDFDANPVTLSAYVPYKNGLEEGRKIYFYPNSGDTMKVINMHNGIENGIYEEFYLGNKRKKLGQMKNGQYDGLFKYWDMSGNMHYTEEYRNGLLIHETFVTPTIAAAAKRKNVFALTDFVKYLRKTKPINIDTVMERFFCKDAIVSYNAFIQRGENNSATNLIYTGFFQEMLDSIQKLSMKPFKILNYYDAKKKGLNELEECDNTSYDTYGNTTLYYGIAHDNYFLIRNVYIISFSEKGKLTNVYVLMDDGKVRSIAPQRSQTDAIYSWDW